MTPHDPVDVLARVRAHLAGIVQDRPIVMTASQVAAGGRNVLRHLAELGAGPLLVIAPKPFAELARESGARHHLFEVEEGDNTVVTQHRWEAALANPPPDVRRVIAEHDPDGVALLMISLWLEATSVLDRPVFGARQPAWTRYEDKLAVDELWRAAGIPAAPSRNVPLERDALRETAHALDSGHGTVWAADADAGVHGGAVAVRWVRDGADAEPVHLVATRGQHWRRAGADETPDATLTITPAARGANLSIVFDPDRIVPGPALAPRVLAAFRWADDELGTKAGQLSAAPDARAPAGSAPATR